MQHKVSVKQAHNPLYLFKVDIFETQNRKFRKYIILSLLLSIHIAEIFGIKELHIQDP